MENPARMSEAESAPLPNGPALYEQIPDLKERFSALTRQWQRDTLFSSDPGDIEQHPSYRAIVDMGRAALPLILAELRSEPHFWFSALRQITGENPVPPEDRGKVGRMADAWLRWAASKGL